jgi:hypothetical protein
MLWLKPVSLGLRRQNIAGETLIGDDHALKTLDREATRPAFQAARTLAKSTLPKAPALLGSRIISLKHHKNNCDLADCSYRYLVVLVPPCTCHGRTLKVKTWRHRRRLLSAHIVVVCVPHASRPRTPLCTVDLHIPIHVIKKGVMIPCLS